MIGTTTSKASCAVILPIVSCWLTGAVPVMISSHSGVTKKQTLLVNSVTRVDTASFPPARRVHTEADAKVQGVTAATCKPGPKSPRNKSEIGQANKGNAPNEIAKASSGGPGRLIERSMTR